MIPGRCCFLCELFRLLKMSTLTHTFNYSQPCVCMQTSTTHTPHTPLTHTDTHSLSVLHTYNRHTPHTSTHIHHTHTWMCLASFTASLRSLVKVTAVASSSAVCLVCSNPSPCSFWSCLRMASFASCSCLGLMS